MATGTSHNDLTTWPDHELVDTIRTLGVGRETYAGTLIIALNERGDSLNTIATKTGVPKSTVKRWARLVRTETCTPQETATT